MTLRQPIRSGGRFPSWWQMFVIAAGALILCSCRAMESPYASAPTAPGVNNRWKPADAARMGRDMGDQLRIDSPADVFG